MKRIKLKSMHWRFIQSRRYDWRELDELIGRRELVEIECPSCEDVPDAVNSLRNSKPGRDGVYKVSQSGNIITVDARGDGPVDD